MGLKITWKRHPEYPSIIIGNNERLPDQFCQFSIEKLEDHKFWVILPSFGFDGVQKKLILREAEAAKEFCEDYLNHNWKDIVRHQIKEMRRRAMKGYKTAVYYETFLEENN